jgi:hypothetical protein
METNAMKKEVLKLAQAIAKENWPLGKRRGDTSMIVSLAPVGLKILKLPSMD